MVEIPVQRLSEEEQQILRQEAEIERMRQRRWAGKHNMYRTFNLRIIKEGWQNFSIDQFKSNIQLNPSETLWSTCSCSCSFQSELGKNWKSLDSTLLLGSASPSQTRCGPGARGVTWWPTWCRSPGSTELSPRRPPLPQPPLRSPSRRCQPRLRLRTTCGPGGGRATFTCIRRSGRLQAEAPEDIIHQSCMQITENRLMICKYKHLMSCK